jgi:carbon monoxide dehydrogenase subunit G
MKPTLTHVFEAADGDTRVTRRIQIETSGLTMALMKPMMKMMVRRRNVEFIANLKRVLET